MGIGTMSQMNVQQIPLKTRAGISTPRDTANDLLLLLGGSQFLALAKVSDIEPAASGVAFRFAGSSVANHCSLSVRHDGEIHMVLRQTKSTGLGWREIFENGPIPPDQLQARFARLTALDLSFRPTN